jgi:hypothetical protein
VGSSHQHGGRFGPGGVRHRSRRRVCRARDPGTDQCPRQGRQRRQSCALFALASIRHINRAAKYESTAMAAKRTLAVLASARQHLDCLLYEVLTKARGGGHGRRLGTGGVWYRGSVRYRHGGPCGCSSALSPSPWHFKSMPDRPARHSNGLTERCMWSSSATSAFSPPILAGGGRLWVGNRKSGFPSQTCLQSALGELIFDAARPRPSATVVTAKSKANGRLELVRGSNRVATANEHPKHRISGIPLQLTMSTPRA